MTHTATSSARRAPRPWAAACAFVFACAAFLAPGPFSTFADALSICSECGRESDVSASFCSHCGAALSGAPRPDSQDASAVAEADADSASANTAKSASVQDVASGAKAAARDWAEARKRRDAGDVAAAFALLRNAQALLAANAGPAPSANAARSLAAEAEVARREFDEKFPAARRQAAITAGLRSAETYFRGEGRVRLGNAWVPSGWVSALPPPSIAAIRTSLPPVCSACAGVGSTPCRSCAGSGTTPCKANGCNGGWVVRKPTNSLTPKTDIAIREKCPVCRGTARVSCRDCAGAGRAICKKCGGTGDAPVCKACAGTGLADCRQCLKKGPDPDCPLCAGTGKVLCPKCGGDGRKQN